MACCCAGCPLPSSLESLTACSRAARNFVTSSPRTLSKPRRASAERVLDRSEKRNYATTQIKKALNDVAKAVHPLAVRVHSHHPRAGALPYVCACRILLSGDRDYSQRAAHCVSDRAAFHTHR